MERPVGNLRTGHRGPMAPRAGGFAEFRAEAHGEESWLTTPRGEFGFRPLRDTGRTWYILKIRRPALTTISHRRSQNIMISNI